MSLVIKTQVCVACRSQRLKQVTQTRGFIVHDNPRSELTNCLIENFLNNLPKKTLLTEFAKG